MTTTAVLKPLRERINFRIIIFVGVVLAPIGLFLYLFVDTMVSGGIWERKDEHGSYKQVDLKAMSSFEMDQAKAVDEDIPAKFRALNGQRVMLVGEMYSGRSAAGRPSDFNLVYSIQKCCFTGVPLVQHFIKATMAPGRRGSYYPGLVKVFGTLTVGVEQGDGQVLSVYRITVESIEPG